jgi:membrane protease YdiL (CAAX protease family)
MKFFKAFIIFLLYVFIFLLIKKLLFFLLEKGILDSFPEIFFETIDISTYLFVFILFFLIFKPNLRLDKQKKLKIKDLLVILLIIIAFRIIEDPLQNIDSIINGKNLELIQGDTFKLNNPFYTLFLLVFITPLLEEFVFRKIMLGLLGGQLFSIIFSSILFSIIHLLAGFDLVIFLKTFSLGMIMSVLFLRKGFIAAFSGHAFYNLIYFVINFYGYKEYTLFINHFNFNWFYWLIVLFSIISLITGLLYIITGSLKIKLSKKN